MKTNINHSRRPALRGAALLALSLLFTTPLFAQPPYNFRYPQSDGLSIYSPQGKSITRLGWCHVVSANSIQAPDGFSDFHLTLTGYTGILFGSFRIGNPGTNEYCSAVCNSTTTANAYLLCGTSHNNNMLVMRVDVTGTVTWSREIVFGTAFSNAVTIVPVNNPPNQGYIVVGNNGSEVAAARLDEAGNIMWAFTYPMTATYLTNMTTDALVHPSLSAENILAITGNHITNTGQDIFRLNLRTTTGFPIWQQSIYSNTAGHVFGNPQIANVGNGINTTDNRVMVSFLQADSPLSSGFTHLNILSTNVFSSAIAWANTYHKDDMFNLTNNDFCRLGGPTARLSALVTEEVYPPFYNPAIVNIDEFGNVNYALSFNEGRRQLAHSIMLIENCGGGTEVFNASDANNMPSTDLQVVANDITSPDCTEPYPWPHVPANLVQAAVTLNPTAGAVAVNYPVDLTNAGLADVFDCQDNPVFFKRGDERTHSEDTPQPWIWPNPANTQLSIATGDTPETVTIFNSLGQPVLTQQVQGTANVDIAHLPTGYYMVTHATASGEVRQEKLVIQH